MTEIIFIILAFILGIAAGILSGLLPGIHANLIATFLISSSAFFLSFLSPITLAVFIVAVTITHTFLSFIPSILLGAPDEDTALSLLPGHYYLNKGRGYEALILTLYGCILGVIIIFLLTPLFIFVFPKIYFYLKAVMFFILTISSLYLLLREKNKILLSIIIFLMAGFLGVATLNLNLKQALLPLLTGLFGSSSLITSIIKKTKLPKQQLTTIKKIKINKKEIAEISLASILSAPLCSFLPALGSGQAAIIGSNITGESDRKNFLVLLGSINIIVAGLSFVTLYSLQEARTGSAAAIEKILPSFTLTTLFIILATIFLSSLISFFLALKIGKFATKTILKFNYQKLSLIVLAFLSAVVIIFSGFFGFLVFITATATGLTAILFGTRRTNLMACLMLPAILLYLPF